MVFMLEALKLIDFLQSRINEIKKENEPLDVDRTDLLNALLDLFGLAFTHGSQGLQAVTSVLGFGSNVDALIPFVMLTRDSERDAKIKKSACAGYATELLVQTLRHSESIDMLRNYAEHLLEISTNGKFDKILSDLWNSRFIMKNSINSNTLGFGFYKVENFYQSRLDEKFHKF